MGRRRLTTTDIGLGWEHQKRAARLKREHRDGTLCWWCGEPMYLDPTRNPDYKPGIRAAGELHADHTNSRAHGGTHADRLMHGDCNRQRGNGDNDHARPALKRLNGGHTHNVMAWDAP